MLEKSQSSGAGEQEDTQLLLCGKNWPAHRPWFYLVLSATIAAVTWFLIASMGEAHWPSGSSLPGFSFGITLGVLVLFEMLLWVRKKMRSWSLFRTQAWMRAHIWLGFLCLPLSLLHSGFRLGGSLSTVLMILLILVIASGVWGLIMQHFLPRRMLDNIPGETIYSQIDKLSEQLANEGETLVRTICRPEAKEAEQPATPELELLLFSFETTISPFLKSGTASGSAIRYGHRADVFFQDLLARLPAQTHPTVETLQRFCDQRRQWVEQARLFFWLHNWLWLHLPLSVALVILMFVHAFVAIKYW